MINKSKNNKIVTYRKEKKLLFLIFINKTCIPRFPIRNLPSKHLNTILNYGRTQSHQRLARVVSLLGRRFISPIRWFLLAAFALVLADLKFGIEAARHRGETIRKSRAIRRSANKIIDYLCWILVATSFGEAFGTPFGIPILPALVLLVVYGCEINSCFNNYFEARGSKLRINIFKWLKNKSDIMVPSDDENDTTKT